MKNRYNYKISPVVLILLLLLAVLLDIATTFTAFAQQKAILGQQKQPGQETLYRQESSRAAERIYIATDRNSYVAGETMWLSVYCIDINDSSRLSKISSIAYLELHNAQSLVLTAKIALIGGRGSGHMELPPNLPTGNYKIISYTKQMLNEREPVYFENVVPIYNVLSSERVEGNVVKGASVVNVEDNSTSWSLSNLGEQSTLDIKFGAGGRIIGANSSFAFSLSNNGNSIVSANISVYKRDSLINNYRKNFAQYILPLSNATPVFNYDFIPEYEGEIISGKVICDNNAVLWDKAIFLSAAGGVSDIFSSYIDSVGSFAFFTTPFFGNRDLILEIPKADSNLNIVYDIRDPFIRENRGVTPILMLDSNIVGSLKERGIEMQLGRRFRVDTLYNRIPINKDPLLGKNMVVYRLDEYTRFPVMEEVVAEYVSELRLRRVAKKADLQVRLDNSFKTLSFSKENTLVLLDGVPVFDHQKIVDYNPLKVETISVYKSDYFIGVAGFSGLVSFKTYKGDYSGLSFGKNVRIMDYQGELYPSKLSAAGVHSINNLPDMRSMLYWDPMISLVSGEKKEVVVNTSSVPGNYIIQVEGISFDGVPFIFSTEFTVK